MQHYSSLELTRADVAEIHDGLGYKVDKGIREGVAVLLALKIPTAGSCEGYNPNHPDIEPGKYTAPYIDINVTFDLSKKTPPTQEKYTQLLEESRQRIETYLKEFDQERNTSEKYKLTCATSSKYHSFRLSNKIGLENQSGSIPDIESYQACKKEMDDFIEFLKLKNFPEDKGKTLDVQAIDEAELAETLKALQEKFQETLIFSKKPGESGSLTLLVALDTVMNQIRVRLGN